MGTDGMSTNDVGIDTVKTIGFRGQDLPLDVDTGVIPSSPLLNFSDSPFVDDDSWAEPPRAADRRLRIAAIVLGLGVVAIAGAPLVDLAEPDSVLAVGLAQPSPPSARSRRSMAIRLP
jgi:hypothetical protein